VEKRLFIGIAIPKVIQTSIIELPKRYREWQDIKWTRPENLHITLCYIGEVPEEMLVNIRSSIQLICKDYQPFKLSFNRLSLAPNNRDARMIWAKYQSNEIFAQLSLQFYRFFDQMQLRQNFHSHPIPHITLARFKSGTTVPIKGEVNDKAIQVSRIVLWESILLESGQRVYEVLDYFYLG